MKYKIPTNELHLSFSRSSGAGGQNVNKVNSKATLHWNAYTTTALPPDILARFLKKYATRLSDEGVITITCQEHRSQNFNTSEVIKKLHEMINTIAIAPKIRKATKPTKSSVKKRLNEKKNHGDKKKNRSEKF